MCPFCKSDDMYDYVDVGYGIHIPVGVTCCQFGAALIEQQAPYEELRPLWIASMADRQVEYFERLQVYEVDVPF
mgnify:CR=1 FL=1